MDFSYNPDQLIIADSVRRMFAGQFSRDVIQSFAKEQTLQPQWRRAIAESGLLGIAALPEAGGLGLGAVDALPVLIEAGRNLVPFPVAEGIAAAARLAASHPDLAAAVIGAEMIVALAPESDLSLHQGADGCTVSGIIDAVFWGREAGWLIAVIADGHDTGQVLLRMDGPGVSITQRESTDLTYPVCRVVLTSCPVECLPAADPSWARLRTVLACAELEGAARSCLTLAVDYMKQRKQFGQEIGRFQALKHIAATDALYIENMQVANEYASWAHDENAADAEMAVHIAKQYASESARIVAQDSIQCHGGIGFTWVYGLHFYLRRIMRLGAMFGTSMQHREQLLRLVIGAQDASHNIKETS